MQNRYVWDSWNNDSKQITFEKESFCGCVANCKRFVHETLGEVPNLASTAIHESFVSKILLIHIYSLKNFPLHSISVYLQSVLFSHNLQYPPIFCKLVKRSLACDPIRRPTLPQILSIIKKDSKVIALMTGKRLGGPSSSTVAQQRGVSTGGSYQERGLWGSMESINRHAQGGQLWPLVGVD